MQPDDLSMPRGDNRIKQKLSLHVKKRLQETGKASQIPSDLICPPVASTRGAPTGSKTKKLKIKHSPSTSSTVVSIAGAQFGSGSNSKPTAPIELILSPGTTTGGNSNDATNSSFNSVDLDPDANGSNDGQERTEKNGGRSVPKPDIFTLILNEKKNSLMRDPEVIKLLSEMMAKRNKH
ncbi:uncharacterized protein LOC131678808 [Topomyia yanbarensis]|uniref:uncharacterized protein LOC131678808 n=1 Tax=Topomyia yanbarensis TaxID=2498891 RepID=UPI00273CD87B|nr:uncharacterized protein LOC131678808 [Topomyia yanbarensis]